VGVLGREEKLKGNESETRNEFDEKRRNGMGWNMSGLEGKKKKKKVKGIVRRVKEHRGRGAKGRERR
jgi:hypothetical protein